ncbi:MAG TPA: class I SAM-dependent methyltransferase [Chloroflexota bacterium]
MTGVVFGADYAGAYDALYQDKDYAAECDLIERVFQREGHGQVRRVLDLGCGTGGHSAQLAARGYSLVGVDRAPDMLRLARERGGTARFEAGDITHLDLAETFDAVLMMFAVLGYQARNADVLAALASARRHLRPGGLLFADVWYGPAVLAQRPSERVKVIETATGQVIRVADGQLDTRSDVCNVRYHLWRIDGGRVTAEMREQHHMRYFFAPELELFLSETGFESGRLGAFPEFDEPPSEQTWNVAFVARAAAPGSGQAVREPSAGHA